MTAAFSERHPVQSDLPAVQALLLSGMGVTTHIAALMAEMARDDRDLRVLVDSDGTVAGWSAARVLLDESELLEIVVAAQHRRAGLGARLLDGLLKRLHSAGCQTLHLEVRATNIGAIALYESRGFSRVGLRRGYYSDGEDACLYHLDLSTGGVGVSRG